VSDLPAGASFILTLSYPFVYPSGTLGSMKDAGLRIRVQRGLREQFLEACRADDKPAAQVLREFMRGYVARHASAAADAEQGTKSVPQKRARTGSRRQHTQDGRHRGTLSSDVPLGFTDSDQR
jgi:hypothetical protein